MEGLFNDADLELCKKAQRLRHSRKTKTRRNVFLGQGGLYKQEILEFFNMDGYGHQRHKIKFFSDLGGKVNWHVAREVIKSIDDYFLSA